MSQTFTRSQDRTVVYPAPNAPTQFMLRWPAKDPLTRTDYSFDVGDWLAESGDAIASYDAVPRPNLSDGNSLVLSDMSHADGIMTLWIGGGMSPADHSVDFLIQTEAGRTLKATVWLLVQRQSVNSRVQPSILIGDGGDRGERGSDALFGDGPPTNEIGRPKDSYTDNIDGSVWLRGEMGWVGTGKKLGAVAGAQAGAEAAAAAVAETLAKSIQWDDGTLVEFG